MMLRGHGRRYGAHANYWTENGSWVSLEDSLHVVTVGKSFYNVTRSGEMMDGGKVMENHLQIIRESGVYFSDVTWAGGEVVTETSSAVYDYTILSGGRRTMLNPVVSSEYGDWSSWSETTMTTPPTNVGKLDAPGSVTEIGGCGEHEGPAAVEAGVMPKVGQAVTKRPEIADKIENPYDRKVFLDGRPEPSRVWAKRMFDTHLQNNMKQQNLYGRRFLNAGYALFVESAANALARGADKADLEWAIGENSLFPFWQYDQQGYLNARNTSPNAILRDAERLLKNRIKDMQNSGQLRNLKIADLPNTALSTVFDAMSDIQKAMVIRNVLTNPLMSGPVVHTGPQNGPKLPTQYPNKNVRPGTIRTR